ncbi:MAG: tetratricopeptide repeat protein, partial [Candidatus Babeliales bacterium]|nr:tetratricopeptide repeat protein [Candidatus Babeliales bacterium]
DSCTKADLDTDIGYATYGRVSLSLGKYDDAIFGLTKALELNRDYPEARFNLANAYFLTEKYEQSLAEYDKILATSGNEYRVWFNKGEAHLKLNQIGNALTCFEKVRPMRDQLPHLALRLATCYEKTGQMPQAKQELLTVANNNNAPENVRSIAKSYLAQINA